MNKENQDFLERNKKLFEGRNICVGGLDVNGSVSHIVKIKDSIDIRDGKDVTRVMNACDMLEVYGKSKFNGIICMNTLEHMEKWYDAMTNMYACLKKGGHMILSTCTNHKKKRECPDDYWRFTLRELQGMFPNDKIIDSMCHPRQGERTIIWVGVVMQKTTGKGLSPSFEAEAVSK